MANESSSYTATSSFVRAPLMKSTMTASRSSAAPAPGADVGLDLPIGKGRHEVASLCG
jgi:hypothetical protein